MAKIRYYTSKLNDGSYVAIGYDVRFTVGAATEEEAVALAKAALHYATNERPTETAERPSKQAKLERPAVYRSRSLELQAA